MTAKATFTLEADPQKVIAALTKLEEKVGKLEAQNRQLRQSSVKGADDGSKALGGMGAAASRMATSILSAGAAFLTFDGVVGVLKTIDARLDSIAQKGNTAARAMVGLALIQDPKAMGKTVQQFAESGLSVGVKPSDAAVTGQTLQSLYGGDAAKALADMPYATKLMALGVAPEDVSAMATASISRGSSLKQGSAAFYTAADLSPLDAPEFAKAAPSLGAYKDPLTGIAAIAALAAGNVAPGSVPDRTKDLALALALESKLTQKAGKAAKRQGKDYASLSEIEQLEVLKTVIPDTDRSGDLNIAEVQAAGMGEQQKAQALSAVINQLGFLKRTRAAVGSASPDVLDQEIAMLAADPVQGALLSSNKAAALAEYTTMYGPAADTARANAANKREVGQKYMQAGYFWGWDTETGEATQTGRVAYEGMRAGIDPWGIMSGVRLISERAGNFTNANAAPAADTKGGLFGGVIDKLVAALDRNTQATLDNSRQTGETPPAPFRGPNRNTGV